MAYIHPLDPAQAEGKSKELLEAVKARLGKASNILRTMAHAPTVLEGYLAFSGALSKGTLPGQLIEQIALLVAQTNGCEYCLAAHTAISNRMGLLAEGARQTRMAKSEDEKTQAVLTFTSRVLGQKGAATEGDISLLRIAGFYDNQIVEILGVIGLNMFTNYLAKVAGTETDFPRVASVDTELV